ncbi:putative Nuclear speckle splicing regulatory protein 1 [Hypsibius exemplaris]|uniref:Nuclear speckle splicing regulatory protein 1 n=1 Tax=Hypsibius exemplaris TaxID=2072580 RepID=A0A1W0WGR3_HYPEX|nr:putative Nuclear speckle splicing regulatory protein 1 [Hypsibius exemplaris]
MAGFDGGPPKKYGLILPNKKGVAAPAVPALKKPSIFDDDDDDREEFNSRTNADGRKKYGGNSSLWKKETQLTIQKALEEDPTAFEYDSVFDQMADKKAEAEFGGRGKEKQKDRKPKYVQSLLAAAKEREREHDRREERKVQRERETEGGEFAGKEAFVTSSYKRKMQEMKEQEAKEKEAAKVEALLDVTKQKDLTGFYRHLLKQSTGEERVRNAGEAPTPVKPIESQPSSSKVHEFSPPPANLKRMRGEEEDAVEPSAAPQSDSEEDESPAEADVEDAEQASVPAVTEEQIVAPVKAAVVEKKDAYAKHTTEDSAMSARERYLARQAAKAKQT